MPKYVKRKSKNDTMSVIIALVLIVITVLGLINIDTRPDENGKIKISPTFTVGGLTSYGKYLESEKSIYTEEYFACKGLEIKLDFESTIQYQIFYYDKNGSYLQSSGLLENSFSNAIPETAYYARIVISPTFEGIINEKDKKVRWYEVVKYSKQITIKVLKDQSETT